MQLSDARRQPGWLHQQVLSLCPELGTGRLALAVSGGGDSLALLALAAQSFGSRAHVLSVDHGLRAESADECAMVARYAAEAGLSADILPLHMAGGADVQARARAARYAAMAARCRALGIGVLLTAHHADDQAETVLLRLARGSGVGGLGGIRPRTQIAGLVVLRPLLPCRRAELRAIVADAGWTAAEDPSNDSLHYDRTLARRLLRETPWLPSQRLAAAAAHLQQADAALEWAAARAWAGRARRVDGKLRLDCSGLPEELRRRLAVRALAEFGTAADGPALTRLLQTLDAGGSATLGGCWLRVGRDGRWLLQPAPPRHTG